jgi:hypothetical protein
MSYPDRHGSLYFREPPPHGTKTVADEGQQPDSGPGIDIDVMAKLNVAIGELTTELKKGARREQRRLAALPINYPFEKFSSPGAATSDVQDFGGPQNGREWIVRALLAVSVPFAANASVVSWYVGQIMPGLAPGQLPSGMLRWQFPSVPNMQTFTSDIIKVRFGEHLIAGLTSVPASSNIGLIAVVNDQPQYAGSPVVAE